MQSQIRKIDCLARYGGEEFVLASSIEKDGSEFLAEKLRMAVEQIDNQYRPVTVSIGATQWHPSDNHKSLIARADSALYEAKKSGKNRVSVVPY